MKSKDPPKKRTDTKLKIETEDKNTFHLRDGKSPNCKVASNIGPRSNIKTDACVTSLKVPFLAYK